MGSSSGDRKRKRDVRAEQIEDLEEELAQALFDLDDRTEEMIDMRVERDDLKTALDRVKAELKEEKEIKHFAIKRLKTTNGKLRAHIHLLTLKNKDLRDELRSCDGV